MATISLCMIVKNEEKVLSRCLDSIKNAVDEIIIADTGSTDSTKDIAYRYTDKVYDFEWTDNFSEARNFSFSKATKDFILRLDADVITSENNTKLIELKNNLDNTDTVMMKYNTAFDEDSNATFSYFRERLVRRATPHKWKGRVHEAIEYTGRTFTVILKSIIILLKLNTAQEIWTYMKSNVQTVNLYSRVIFFIMQESFIITKNTIKLFPFCMNFLKMKTHG